MCGGWRNDPSDFLANLIERGKCPRDWNVDDFVFGELDLDALIAEFGNTKHWKTDVELPKCYGVKWIRREVEEAETFTEFPAFRAPRKV